MESSGLIPALFGALGLIVAWFIYGKVKEFPAGEAKVAQIAEQIHVGAMVFMRREYKFLTIFCGVLVVVLFATLGFNTAFAFIVGALTSAGAGYIGMSTATRANVRTTTAAHTQGAEAALTVAFFGGSSALVWFCLLGSYKVVVGFLSFLGVLPCSGFLLLWH